MIEETRTSLQTHKIEAGRTVFTLNFINVTAVVTGHKPRVPISYHWLHRREKDCRRFTDNNDGTLK